MMTQPERDETEGLYNELRRLQEEESKDCRVNRRTETQADFLMQQLEARLLRGEFDRQTAPATEVPSRKRLVRRTFFADTVADVSWERSHAELMGLARRCLLAFFHHQCRLELDAQFVAHAIDGRSLREIAKREGVTMASVRTRVDGERKRLQGVFVKIDCGDAVFAEFCASFCRSETAFDPLDRVQFSASGGSVRRIDALLELTVEHRDDIWRRFVRQTLGRRRVRPPLSSRQRSAQAKRGLAPVSGPT